jgi:hypothetical protein
MKYELSPGGAVTFLFLFTLIANRVGQPCIDKKNTIMRYKQQIVVSLISIAVIGFVQCEKGFNNNPVELVPASVSEGKGLINEGKNIFRFDTFGDEEFWSGLLHIDKAIAGAANGGFGNGVSPRTALGSWPESRRRSIT